MSSILPTSVFTGFVGGAGDSTQLYLVGGAVTILLVLGYQYGYFGGTTFSDFLSYSTDPAKVLATGAGAGEGDGLATSSNGTARADTYQPELTFLKSKDNDPQTTFDPTGNELNYGNMDTHQLTPEARTYPYY